MWEYDKKRGDGVKNKKGKNVKRERGLGGGEIPQGKKRITWRQESGGAMIQKGCARGKEVGETGL